MFAFNLLRLLVVEHLGLSSFHLKTKKTKNLQGNQKPKNQSHGAQEAIFLICWFSRGFFVFWEKSKNNHVFFWVFEFLGGQKPKKTLFFLDFHLKTKKSMGFLVFQSQGGRKTKKIMCFFGFWLKNQKTMFFFCFCLPWGSKTKKHMVFFWILQKKTKKTSRQPKNPTKIAS